MATSKSSPHLIVIRGTKEMDDALVALAELHMLSKAQMFMQLLQEHREYQLGSDEEILKKIKARHANFNEKLALAEKEPIPVANKGGRKKSGTTTTGENATA